MPRICNTVFATSNGVALATGYRARDLADGATETLQQLVRTQGKNMFPDASAALRIARAALETGDEAAVRQCLRIAHHLNLAQYLSSPKEAPAEHAQVAPWFKKDALFYAHKLTSALVGIVDTLMPRKTEGSPRLGPEERTSSRFAWRRGASSLPSGTSGWARWRRWRTSY